MTHVGSLKRTAMSNGNTQGESRSSNGSGPNQLDDLSIVSEAANRMSEEFIYQAAAAKTTDEAIAKIIDAKQYARLSEVAADTKDGMFRLSLKALDTIIGNMKA